MHASEVVGATSLASTCACSRSRAWRFASSSASPSRLETFACSLLNAFATSRSAMMERNARTQALAGLRALATGSTRATNAVHGFKKALSLNQTHVRVLLGHGASSDTPFR